MFVEEEGKEEPLVAEVKEKKMTWVEVGLLLFGFSSPSACVGVCYSVGATGVVLGPLLCIIVTLATCIGALMLNELVVELNPAECELEAVGRMVLGKRGGLAGRVLQEGNFFLYMPVALLICAEAAQDFMPVATYRNRCVDYYVVFVAFFCFSLTQLRRVTGRGAAFLSYLSLISCFVVVALLLVVVVTDPDPYPESELYLKKEKASFFGNPDMREDFGSVTWRRGYSNLMLGASTTAWAFVPTFITVESSRALKFPKRDFEKGLALAAFLNVLFFFLAGIVAVLMWGWRLEDPIMATEDVWPSARTTSRTLNFFWFVATAISYAFSSMALTDACQRRWLPTFNLDDWSLSSFLTWGLISLPSFCLALLFAIAVPSLFAMLAVTTACTVPWVNNLYPAVLYYYHTKNKKIVSEKTTTENIGGEGYSLLLSDEKAASSSLMRKDIDQTFLIKHISPNTLVAFTFGVGLLIFICCAVGAVAKLADHQLRGPTAIGCPGWQIFEDDLNAMS